MWRRKPPPQSTTGPQHAADGLADHQARPKNDASLTIDALGRKCPIPIIMLADQINSVGLGAVVAVLADDPAAVTDIPAWCRLKSHEHVASYDLPQGGWSIHVRRKY
ncbi:sulfurtransferase TusA family protein [Acrocarpospora catenulata]|uniref:sulfurtransferase TusA family protein n=1 Tax=Acrocarpospora catenulata TaxID=2836182 RepID=UPI001BDAF629|nr:sulfurtransferase TusA family protein [Acrocarpospora catenulata]